MDDITPESQNISPEKKYSFLMWTTIVAILFGAYFRLKGLGKWPLCIDEYYIAKSVGNIIKNGLPEFECGGYYTRGLIYQYLAVPLQFLPGNKEFYLRIISLFFNLLAIHPLYELGKKFNKTTSYLVIILFCFSIWEIEFSRFARMYAPFQTLTLYYLLFFVKAILDNDSRNRKYCYLVSVIGIFLYEGAIFFLLLNFVMLIVLGKHSRKNDFLIAIIIFLIGYFYLTIDFRHLSVTSYIPSDVLDVISQGKNKGQILRPLILIKFIGESITWILLSIVPLSVSFFIAFHVLKNKMIDYRKKFFLFTLILFSISNLFGCIVFAAIILILLGWFQLRDFSMGIFKASLFASGCNFFFWLLYGVTSVVWHAFFEPLNNFYAPKKLFVVLFKYPDVFEKILHPWISAIPITGLMLLIFIGIGFFIWLFKKDPRQDYFALISAFVLILFVLIGIIRTTYSSTRYTFFLYPVMLLLAVSSMINIANIITHKAKYQNILLCCFTFGFILFSEDFRLNHLVEIDSKEINFRMNYNQGLADHFYFRRDVRSPAEFINSYIQTNDVVISTKRSVEYYLKRRLDYSYEDLHSTEIMALIACNGEKEIWTNANLVYRETELLKLIKNHT